MNRRPKIISVSVSSAFLLGVLLFCVGLSTIGAMFVDFGGAILGYCGKSGL